MYVLLILMSIITIIRMTLLNDAQVYVNNALMNANLFALGLAFLIFGLFNMVFVGGFFKTAYKFGLEAGTKLIVLSDESGIALITAKKFEENMRNIMELASKKIKKNSPPQFT